MKRRSRLPFSKMFVNAVLEATASCLSDSRAQQRNSMAVCDTDRFPTPSHPSFVEKCQLKDDDIVSISSEMSTNVSTVTASSCYSTSTACSAKTYYPVAYFEFLVEDATNRLEEALKFFLISDCYSFTFEFHIKILNDLLEELGNPPQRMEIEKYDNVLQLRQRLRQLLLHLVKRRKLFLGCANDQSRNLNISHPAGAEPYLKAAAEARAARERQCRMIVLMEEIVNLGREENMCKQRRLKAEAELIRYVDKLVKHSDDKEKLEYNKYDSVNEDAHNGESTSRNQAQDGYEFEPSSAYLSTNSCTVGRPREIYDSKETVAAAATREMPLLKPSACCIFCGELHHSHLCLEISTLEKRQRYFREHGLCPICGTSHKAACADAMQFCEWPNCLTKNSHHSSLCPIVEYPITAEIAQAYVRRLNDVKRIHEYSNVSEW